MKSGLMASQSAKNQLLSVFKNYLEEEIKEMNCEQHRETVIARRYKDVNESKAVQERK